MHTRGLPGFSLSYSPAWYQMPPKKSLFWQMNFSHLFCFLLRWSYPPRARSLCSSFSHIVHSAQRQTLYSPDRKALTTANSGLSVDPLPRRIPFVPTIPVDDFLWSSGEKALLWDRSPSLPRTPRLLASLPGALARWLGDFSIGGKTRPN